MDSYDFCNNLKDKKNTFITTPFEDYFCEKCGIFLLDPWMSNCGHNFCKDCLDLIEKSTKLCPTDLEEIIEKTLNFKDRKKISKLRIKCFGHEYGCLWEGIVEEFNIHYADCEVRMILCKLNCGQSFPKNILENHEVNLCPERKSTCLYCHKSMKFKNLTAHFDRDCLEIEIKCPNNCEKDQVEILNRKNLSEHIKVCPLELVICHFEGCTEKIHRYQVDDHLKENYVDHLKTLNQQYFNEKSHNSRLSQKIEFLLDQIKISENKIAKLEENMNDQLIQKIDSQQNQIKILENKYVKPEENINNQFIQKLESQQNQIKLLENKLAKLEENLNNQLIQKIQSQQNQIKVLENKFTSLESYSIDNSALGKVWTLVMSSKYSGPPNTFEALQNDNIAEGAGTNSSANQFIKAAFFHPVKVTSITLAGPAGMSGGWCCSYVNGRYIQYSNDDINYTTLMKIEGVAHGPKKFSFGAITAKFWRLYDADGKGYVATGIMRFE